MCHHITGHPWLAFVPDVHLLHPSVLTIKVTRPGVLEVHPATGIVHAGEEKKKDSNKARILVGCLGWRQNGLC